MTKRNFIGTCRQTIRLWQLGLVVLVLCGVGAESALAQGSIDRIRRRTGIDTGKISKVSPLEVVLTKNGVDTKVPVEEIRSIYFSGEPSELKSARLALARGKADDALETLKKVDRESIDRPEILQELDYLNLQARRDLAISGQRSMSSVVKLADEFVTSHRRSYHLSEAIELLGHAQLAVGATDKALQQFRKLAKAPSPYFQARSAILIGKLLQQQGDHDAALAEFDKAIAAAQKSPAADSERLAAMLYRAISQSAQGEIDQATETVREIIAKTEPSETELLATAYNALGDCYLQSDKQKSARDAFLHVDVLFSSSSEQHAKSLYELSKLWPELGHDKRGLEARQRLVEEYPSSRWARK